MSAQDPPGLPASLRDRLSFLLYRAATQAAALGDDAVGALGLSARRYGVLTVLAEHGPSPQRAVADVLGIDRATMVGLVDDLEAAGLVERRRNPRDRRAYALTVTEPGRRVQTEAAGRMLQCERDYLAPLDADEQRLLHTLVSRLVSHEGHGGPTSP